MQIAQKIKEWMEKWLGVARGFSVEHPKEMEHGDYSSNVALIEAKKQAKNPKRLAEEYVEILKQANKDDLLGQVEKIEVAGAGFINFFLKKEFFADAVSESMKLGEKSGENKNLSGQKIFIEHTQPNPFKEFHIGHLMNNTIGESIVRIVRANSAEVKTASYHGDVGLHVAKYIWGIKNSEMHELFPDGRAYAKGHKAYGDDEVARKEIMEINKKIYERSDKDINDLYDRGKDLSLNYFDFIYKRLGSDFDYHFYESEAGNIGKELVLKNVPKIFQESEGATVFKGENFEPKTHTRVFLNSDGLPTYEAKELGLAEIKKEKWKYDESITVTANEQDAFFDVVEIAIGEVFPELKGKLKHISHGMLRLPDGKMSSRTGNVITAESLIDDVKNKILEKMADREMNDSQKQEVVEIVAIGAIKYSILRQAIGGHIIFDFDKSLSFEGDSGPYLQYAYVRAQSVLKKAKKISLGNASEIPEALPREIPEKWQTTNLEKLIARFGEVVERAGREYAPHHIATYLTELASAFNGFYTEHKIADSTDPTSGYKLALTKSFGIVMKKGLDLLGIRVPDEM